MYGLWLFKEIETEYGYCKVEIFRRGYNGSQIEIGALAANSLTLSLENLGEITAPIGKSVCSFEIIDTAQINYDDFFTPDATAYKVVVSSRVESGAYVTRWSGYVTPDFFAENLSYRTPISISARDNIGYLNDVDFDLAASTITIRELITKAFARIAEDYPMSLSFVSQKQTAEGILAIDATISTLLLKEMSWGEALETILHDLGLQMRWVDNNTIAVMDLSQIPEYYGIQEFNFIQSSGYREIAPAWRQLSQSQDYGLRENFFEGWMRSDNLTFIKSQTIQTPDEYYGHEVRYYTPNNWGVAREIYTTDPTFYNSSFGEKIIFSAVSKDNPSTTYMSWSADILTSNKPLTIKFKAMNSVLYPYGGIKPYPLQLRLYDPFLAFARTPGDYLQIGMRFNLFLHAKDNKTYVMREDWMEDNGTGGGEYLNFTLDKISLESYQSQEGSGSFPVGTRPSEKELTITANTIPYDGVLELRIYGYYVVDYKFGLENGTSVSHSPNFDKFFAYIDGVTYTFDNSDIPTGQDTAVQINELHNVKGSQDYIFGEVPLDHGGINAYAGGLFKADGTELYGFQRNAEGENYNLLELVGREAIHFNKKNYNKLSGQIKNLDKEPLMFNRLFIREGKTYYPYNCSLNIISNEMNITTMQEVEPYETASFTEINSEVVTGGGATVGGGNNTVLQYSEEAGNVKRVFELDTATEEQKKDAYLLIDNVGFPEAKKVHTSDLFNDLGLSIVEQDGKTWLRSEHDFFSEGEVASGGPSGSNPDEPSSSIVSVEQILTEGTPIANVIVNGVDNIIYAPESGGVSGDYLPLRGGTIEGTSASPFGVNSTDATQTYITIRNGGVGKAAFGYHTLYGAFMYDFTSVSYLGVKDNGTPIYVNGGIERELIHSGNIGNYITGGGTPCLPLSGGTLSGPLTISFGKESILPNIDSAGLHITRSSVAVSDEYAAGLYLTAYQNKGVSLYGGGYGFELDYYNGSSLNKVITYQVNNDTVNINKQVLISPGGAYGVLIGTGENTIDSWKADGSNAGLYLNWQSAGDIYMGVGGGITVVGNAPITPVKEYPFVINFKTEWGGIDFQKNSVRKASVGYETNEGVFIQNRITNNVLYLKDTGAMEYNGNFVATGEVTSGSDERYKRIESHAEIDIETIANAPIINFKWTDREDEKVHLGSTAQYWYNTSLCNGVIPTDDEKLWTMGYGQIALAGLVSVAKKVVNHEEMLVSMTKKTVNHEERLQIVEKELADYKAENQILKQQLNEYRRS